MAYLIRHFSNGKGDWSRNPSRNCFWDGYWGRSGQRLANFSPCREKQSQKSLENLIRPSFLSRSKVANKDEFYFVHAFVSFATD